MCVFGGGGGGWGTDCHPCCLSPPYLPPRTSTSAPTIVSFYTSLDCELGGSRSTMEVVPILLRIGMCVGCS
jgi:hypothetical protein